MSSEVVFLPFFHPFLAVFLSDERLAILVLIIHSGVGVCVCVWHHFHISHTTRGRALPRGNERTLPRVVAITEVCPPSPPRFPNRVLMSISSVIKQTISGNLQFSLPEMRNFHSLKQAIICCPSSQGMSGTSPASTKLPESPKSVQDFRKKRVMMSVF